MDLEDVEYQLSKAKLLGSKGTTGTQASFLELFDGDHEKCKKLDQHDRGKDGLSAGCYAVSGQTYSRKVDSQMLQRLAGIAQSAAKFSNDIRLLAAFERRWRSPLKRIRSVLRPWRTSAIPCVASGSLLWPAM